MPTLSYTVTQMPTLALAGVLEIFQVPVNFSMELMVFLKSELNQGGLPFGNIMVVNRRMAFKPTFDVTDLAMGEFLLLLIEPTSRRTCRRSLLGLLCEQPSASSAG